MSSPPEGINMGVARAKDPVVNSVMDTLAQPSPECTPTEMDGLVGLNRADGDSSCDNTELVDTQMQQKQVNAARDLDSLISSVQVEGFVSCPSVEVEGKTTTVARK